MRKRRGFGLLLIVSCLGNGFTSPLMGEEQIDFNRDIRPILSDHCFQCHGPDAAVRVSEFRLDQKASMFGELGDEQFAVVPNAPERSELVRRVLSTDAEYKMPPPAAERQLTVAQTTLLTRWVEQGARWQEHWSFVPIAEPVVPHLNHAWPRNSIDGFVLERLVATGRQPSEEASQRTLVRRLYLDLTGLPPTLADVERFLKDESPTAYGDLVDRLLKSKHYGERMSLLWLDAARFADTSGYQNDGPREMWRWRDWVIDAFNDNMPFDQFTIEQLAGDLLPDATVDQRVATAFNRNHRGNAEGGIIPEEYQVEYVVDRVETTSTVWLGLTVGCARCHDHKYDPISQRDFYRLFAFFNQVPESGRAIKEGNSPPYLVAPTKAQQQSLQTLEDESRQLEERWDAASQNVADAYVTWQVAEDVTTKSWFVDEGLEYYNGLDRQSLVAQPTAEKPVVEKPVVEKPVIGEGDGKIGKAADFRGLSVDLGDHGDFGYFDKFTLAAWVRPTRSTGTVLSRMTPVDQGGGYYVHLEEGHVQVNLVKRWLDDSIRVATDEKLPLGEWSHILVTYDGSRVAKGVQVYIDGKPQKMRVLLDGLNQTFASTEPLRVGGGHRPFFGRIDEVRLYDRAVSPAEATWISDPSEIANIRRLLPADRSAVQERKLLEYFRLFAAPAEYREVYRAFLDKQRAVVAFRAALPTVMVMADQPGVRKTFVLQRGRYDQPGEVVTAMTPASLAEFPDDFPRNRLGLARWLVSPQNSLTARVFVNRIWQMHFGAGLVRTPEDFGAQGARPTHSDLLDWLSSEFIASGWDIKYLHKLIVTSATFRQRANWQASAASDPENQWLARGPRVRLDAELIRDQALAIGGLLSTRIGGPSVRPYQPEGLWKEIATVTEYDQSHGADLYRRGLYTYWKRTVPPPTMMAFDAATREACTVQRSRTNTPLQALALMNDVTFVEAARGLAQQAMSPASGGEDPLKWMFSRATCRPPTVKELAVLEAAHARLLADYKANPTRADKWLALGELKTPADADTVSLATLATIASLILNLDEVITRE
jgi:hypothetical protein